MENNQVNNALATFQFSNCACCQFAERKLVGTGLPCCTYPGPIVVSDIRCESRRRTDGRD